MRLSRFLPFAALAASLPTVHKHEPRWIVETSAEEIVEDGYENPYTCFDTGLSASHVLTNGHMVRRGIENACLDFRGRKWKKDHKRTYKDWEIWFTVNLALTQLGGDDTWGNLDMDIETCIEEYMYLVMMCPRGGTSHGEKFEFFLDPNLFLG